MKSLLLILILLTYCPATKAQSEIPLPAMPPIATQTRTYPHMDKCGDPRRESMIWSLLSGRVVQVIDGNTIKVVLTNKKRKLITLAAVDAPKLKQAGGEAARNALAELVLNKEVEIDVEMSFHEHKELTGIVRGQQQDINLALIESGVAHYKQLEPYKMPNYIACLYRLAEGDAREAKRGLWQRVSN